MENISIFDAMVDKCGTSYHCSICGNKIPAKDVPFKANFLICDECKEAIKYAKELRKKEVIESRDSISYTYVTRYYVFADKEEWEGYNKIYHYSVNTVQFPEDQVSDANMYNNDITNFVNYNDAQKCCDILNRDWEKVYGKQ